MGMIASQLSFELRN